MTDPADEESVEDLALFEGERHHVDEAKALLDDPQADPARVRATLAGLRHDYEALLHRFAKVARLSDASHRRLHKAREELDRQNELLRDHLRLQAEVERISRHDLKTPLASIISIPELLLATARLGPRERELLGLVHEAGLRMLHMVDLSLDLLRMERGTYPFVPQPVDVAAVARRACQDLAPLAAARGVTFLVEAPSAPTADAEELLCYSMLANLVKNAVEASAPRTTVTVGVAAAGNEIVLRVHNQGVVASGFRADFFSRYHGSDKPGGTGLGTYSARLMAQTQGGHIAMTTGENEGTTVTVVLRAAGSEAATAGSPTALPLAALRILVAEDDAIQRTVLTHLLPQPPLTVETVTDGRAAVEAAERLRPDVVLMDMELPLMSGVEAIAALREREASSGCPPAFVVGLSAHDDDATRVRFQAAGCDRYLTKPVDGDELLRLLGELSRGRPAGLSRR